MVNRLTAGSKVLKEISVKTIEKEVVDIHIGDEKTWPKQSEEDQYLSIDKARKMTESLNKFLETSNTQLRFKFHDELKEYYVTIVNSKDEVIREIPSKKLMDIFAAMQDFLGILVDRKI